MRSSTTRTKFSSAGRRPPADLSPLRRHDGAGRAERRRGSGRRLGLPRVRRARRGRRAVSSNKRDYQVFRTLIVECARSRRLGETLRFSRDSNPYEGETAVLAAYSFGDVMWSMLVFFMW